jgi:hypothetical protein
MRRERRAALTGDITEWGAYHLVYDYATAFFPELRVPSSFPPATHLEDDRFQFCGKGSRQTPVEIAEQQTNIGANKKQILFIDQNLPQ